MHSLWPACINAFRLKDLMQVKLYVAGDREKGRLFYFSNFIDYTVINYYFTQMFQ